MIQIISLHGYTVSCNKHHIKVNGYSSLVISCHAAKEHF